MVSKATGPGKIRICSLCIPLRTCIAKMALRQWVTYLFLAVQKILGYIWKNAKLL